MSKQRTRLRHNRRQEDEQALDPRQQDSAPERAPHPLVQDTLALQGDLGNQAVAGLIADDPALAAQDQLGEGQVLDPHLRATMERAYGQDFADVRVHTGGAAAQLADRENAHAVTVGQDIAFGSGEYQPGTAIGDAIMAHELAHVVQQSGAQEPDMMHAATTPQLEQDANRSAMGALGLFGRLAGGLRNIAGNAAPRLRSGLALQACTKAEEAQMPEFFGEHSKKCAEDLKEIAETWDLIGNVIVYGTLLTIVTSTPAETAASGSHDVTPQAQALASIPVIARAQMTQRIQFLLLEHGNDLNQQETRFWEQRIDLLNQ